VKKKKGGRSGGEEEKGRGSLHCFAAARREGEVA
jgi:hypothetical protein